jgi:DNA-binding GntR family transcriptional regulator
MARLGEIHGISRGTARRVLTTLRDWGLVEITPGWGTFVARRDSQQGDA